MVYGQLSYEQIYSGTRAKGQKGTLQANDGDGCLMSTLANITSNGILSAPFFVGNGSGLTGLPTTLQQVVNKGNTVTSNTVQIYSLVTTGSVTGIANILPVHTLDVGSNLYVSELGSNVLFINGNLYATKLFGDGSSLTGIQSSAPTLQSVVNQGNVVTGNTVQFSSLVTSSLTGIANILPVHTLDVGSNLYVSELGSNVLFINGNLYATKLFGDGSSLIGVQASAPTLQSVINVGNVVTGNTVQFSSLVTDLGSLIGISNLNPIHALDVGVNFYVTDTGRIKCELNTSDNDDIYPVSFLDTNTLNSNNSPILFNDNIGIKPNKGILNIKGYGAAIDLADRTYNSNVWHHHVNSFGSDISQYFVYYQPNGKSFMSFASDGRAAFASMNNNQEYIPNTPSTVEFGSNVAMYDLSPSGYVLKVTGNTYSDGLLTTGTANSGIANTNPIHTLDVGSNLYVSDTSVNGNVLVVKGNIFTNGAFQMSTLQSNGVIFVNSSNILSTDYASFRYDPTLHILKVDDVGGGDLRLVSGGGIFKQATIKGQAIYTEPNNGGEIHFQLADNGVVTNMPCIGVAMTNYNNNDTGYIVTHGPIFNLTTSSVMVDTLTPGASGDIGKIVYVSNVAGKFTITRPTNPANLVQNLGIILKVTGNGVGQTFDMQILGTGRYEDAPNLIQAAQANVYQYLSVGGALNTSANLYVTGNAYISSNLSVGGSRIGISNVNPVHTLDVGSNLYVSELASNVLFVRGNVAATYFVGDGSRLSGIQTSAPTLQSVINQGNVVTGNTVQLSNLVTTSGSLTGMANLVPVHTLDVGSNLYVSELGSNVLFVRGNVAATYFYGNAAYLTGITSGGSVTVTPVPSNINMYYPVLSSVTTGTPSLYTANPNVYYQGSNLYISGTIKVLNTSKSLIESNIGLGMNQRYGIGADTTLQKLTLFTPDTEGYISFGQAKSDGTYIELANVNSLSTMVSNLVVSATDGAFSTLIANTINVNQSSTSYKTIKVTSVNGTSLRNINFTNTIEGAQTIINIYPLRTSDLDIFANFSNTVGHVGTRTKVNFLSNIIINSASHAILACYTTDSNTFVSVSEYF